MLHLVINYLASYLLHPATWVQAGLIQPSHIDLTTLCQLVQLITHFLIIWKLQEQNFKHLIDRVTTMVQFLFMLLAIVVALVIVCLLLVKPQPQSK